MPGLEWGNWGGRRRSSMAEKRLTKEVAEQFLADDESVDSREFTELDDEAAEILRKHEGHLNLSGLTSLSDSAAKSLCGKNEEPTNESLENYDLLLNGLTSLSDAAAESLSKYKDFLGLNGLECLSDAAAESLNKYDGFLYVDFDNLPASTVEILRKHPSFQDDEDDE